MAAAFSYNNYSSPLSKITCSSSSSDKHVSSNPPPQKLSSTTKYPYKFRLATRAQKDVIHPLPTAATIGHRPGHITDHSMMEKRTRRLGEARLIMFNDKQQQRSQGKSVLVMIDALQRLGLDYHFEQEIATALEDLYYRGHGGQDDDHDLFLTSLNFRLLRQHGYHVPSDVFEKFRNNDGTFGDKYYNDVTRGGRGLIELYEASFWTIGAGEESNILNEGGDQLTAQMKKLASTTTSSHHQDHRLVSALANHSLRHPFHRSLPKFHINNHLNILHTSTSTTRTSSTHHSTSTLLADLVKLDFNVNQSTHREEVGQVSKWWKELELADELKFARSEPVKWYMWPLASLPDPKFSEERVEITKPASFVYLLDDVFDVYGSLDELALFTEIVNRWDIEASHRLPDYMRKCFIALDGFTNEFGYKVFKRHGLNPTHFLRQAWGKLFKAFLVEAKWLKSSGGDNPKAEEYLKNGIVSSGVQVVLAHFFFLLGHGLTQQNIDLVNGDNPPIISSVAKILRLCDDLTSMDEEHDGCDGSYVDFYMKEHPESSIDATREHVKEMIEETWKQFNHECLSMANTFPAAFTKAAHNTAKMVSLMEDMGGNNNATQSVEDHIKFMLYGTFPV